MAETETLGFVDEAIRLSREAETEKERLAAEMEAKKQRWKQERALEETRWALERFNVWLMRSYEGTDEQPPRVTVEVEVKWDSDAYENREIGHPAVELLVDGTVTLQVASDGGIWYENHQVTDMAHLGDVLRWYAEREKR